MNVRYKNIISTRWLVFSCQVGLVGQKINEQKTKVRETLTVTDRPYRGELCG